MREYIKALPPFNFKVIPEHKVKNKNPWHRIASNKFQLPVQFRIGYNEKDRKLLKDLGKQTGLLSVHIRADFMTNKHSK